MFLSMAVALYASRSEEDAPRWTLIDMELTPDQGTVSNIPGSIE